MTSILALTPQRFRYKHFPDRMMDLEVEERQSWKEVFSVEADVFPSKEIVKNAKPFPH
jgi:hypothetical protein